MEEITFEKHNKVSGIYIIHFKGGEYNYVGQSINLWSRKVGHLCELNKNKHGNKKMQSVYNKYNNPSFHVLKICEKSELDIHEQKFIDIYYDGYKKCLNLLPTASSFFGYKHSDEFKKKCSLNKKGKKFSESHKLNMSKSFKGRILSDEHRKNIGLTKIGNTYVRGTKRTYQQKLNMSIAQKKKTNKNKTFSELNIPRRKPVVQIDKEGNLICRFESVTSAGNNGFDRKAVSRCANGKREFYLNCKWIFEC